MLIVENLLIVDTNKSRCCDIESLKHQINANTNLSLNGDTVSFNAFTIQMSIIEETSAEPYEIYFILRFSCAEKSDIELFSKTLREIRSSTSLVTKNSIALRDDISTYYSIKAYPELNNLENLMRNLIARFMIKGHGADWLSERIPHDISSTKERSPDLLHQLDFIQLADLLFSENYPRHKEHLISKLKLSKNDLFRFLFFSTK